VLRKPFRTVYVRCARRDHIGSLRLSERATVQHNPEHGLLVRLLINLAKRVGVRPPPSRGNVNVGEMLRSVAHFRRWTCHKWEDDSRLPNVSAILLRG